MKRLLFPLFFVAFLGVKAQVKVTGIVTDEKGRVLPGVSVSIKNSYDGSTSDSLGHFTFETNEKGAQIFEFSLVSYKTMQKPIQIGASDLEINISLKELITELNAVVITAGSFEASDKKKGATLSSLDIVTTASANADITGAIKTLPGAQQIGESEGLFVRGGSATESKIFIDGSLVNNFFYSSLPGIATRGRFNPFLFKGTVFSAGGYSALYGQALSAALILESNDLPEKTEADLNLSVIGIGAGIQKLSKEKRSSWGVSYNYTNLALAFGVIKQKQDFYKTPLYHQGDANFRFKTRNGFIKYYGYLSWNRLGFRSNDIDSSSLQNAFSLENLNTYHNLNWKENIGKGWKLFAAASYSRNRDNIGNELQDASHSRQMITDPIQFAFKNFHIKTSGKYMQGRLVMEKKLGGLNAMRFGGDHFYSREKSMYTAYNGMKYPETVTDHLTAVFAESDFYLSKDLAAKVGARSEYSSLMRKWNLAPRASLAYKFPDNGQLSFAYGIFYQNPETKYLPATSNDLSYARSTHYILQYQRLKDQRSFRAEVFYKKYADLFKTSPNAFGREVAASNKGKGDAKGLEFFWRDKKTFRGVDYWISYSYLETKRDYLNFPGLMTPSFAASHTASLVIKKFSLPLRTGFNASYTFASGRPYYHLKYNSAQNKYLVEDAGKTISYNNLGFSLNYLPNLGKSQKKAFVVWVLSITNVLGQEQVFGYNYSSIKDYKEAITPAAKRFVYIGCFLNFGIDRTQDAINNNL